MKIYFLIILTWINIFLCDERFYREELGYADRLRFTSGLYRLYNCTVINKRLVSNLKIGIYAHETNENKVSIDFAINDTSVYSLSTVKVEDFYFAFVNVHDVVHENNRVIELIALDSNTGNLIDKTLLYVYVKEDHYLPPEFDSDSKTITLYDDLFLGSVIGKVKLKKIFSDVIFYVDEKNLALMNEFRVSVDGRIFLTKNLNAALKNYFEFYLNARFVDSNLYSSIKISILVKPGSKPSADKIFKNVLPIQPLGINSYTSHLIKRDYNFSISELAPKLTIIGCLDINIPNVNFLIADGDAAGIFQIDFQTGVLFIQDSQYLDYEKAKIYKFSVTGFIKNEIRVLEAQVTIYVVDENDHEPEFNENRYVISITENTPAFTSILKVTASDKDAGNNGRVSYVISNEIKIPFVIDDSGVIMLTELALFPQLRAKYYVYVLAFDWGIPFKKEKEITVEINIQPVNSHSPVLRQQACNFVLSDASSSLFTFSAIDQDFNDNIQYKIDTVHPGFTINHTSGVLSYVPQPGHVETLINVSAYDGKHESKITVLNIKFSSLEGEKVCVENNDFFVIKELVSKINVPLPEHEKFSSTKSNFRSELLFKESPNPFVNVLEDAPVNSRIGHYTTNLECCSIVLYSIESGNTGFNFLIDPFNGSLYIFRPLDRELMASYKLVIKASDIEGNFVMSLLTVNVLDVNDNVPVFTNNGSYTVYVHQDWQIGRKIVTVEAIDLDSNVDIEYSLVNPSQNFKIDSKTGEISLLSSLSDEFYIEYFIQVQATERSLMQDSQGFALVHIIVSELINTPPVCLTNDQQISVSVDSPIGIIVGRILGFDQDQGENGELTYSIESTKQQNQFGEYMDSNIFSNYFSIEKSSGLIQVIKKLPSTFEKFRINAVLEDGGKPRLKTTCNMYATISEGFGNIKPIFTHSDLPLIVTVAEGIPVASIILEVFAKIPGRQIGDGIKYFIIDGNGILDFIMKNEHSGKISNKNSFFSRKIYWLTVQAQLESNPSVFTNSHILIKVKSIKFERPYIYPSVQFITVIETIKTGSKIIQLQTLPLSVNLYNESYFYSFQSGNQDQLFKIDENGTLFVHQQLVAGHYDLNITVTSVSSKYFSYGNVHVIVEHGVSEPDFTLDSMANIQLFETKGSLQPPYLFQVLAENKLQDDFLVFKNMGTNSIFNVNPVNGVVTMNNTLLIGQEYFLNIVAKHSKNQMIGESFIGITIIERPSVATSLSFKKKSYNISIDENKKGEVFEFEKEIDKTTFGPVFFYILSGNDKQKFYFPLRFISKLYVINPLDYEQQQQHKLRILAFDGKSFAETEFNIVVNNLNDNPPSASQSCYDASVKEGFRHLKESILSVKVIDPDNLNPDFKYQTINNFDDSFPFTVGENDGSIIVQPVELDRELKSEYFMTVVASNAVEQTAFCVQISLEDINDNKPLFTSEVYELTIVNTTPVHSTVMVVYAVDKDIGLNGKVSYSFEENNDYFDVDATYGFIYVKSKLNLLTGKTINLKLIGKDHGIPELNGNAYVKIAIVADPNNIWFKISSLTGSVSENVAPGTMLTDSIRVESTAISYEIAENGDKCCNLFWVEPFTGTIFIKSDLDSEKITQCVFVINGALNQNIVTTMNIHVNILDRNDNIPFVKEKSYSGNVSESLSSNSNVLDKDGNFLIVSATDEDQGINGMLRYSIIGNIGKIYFTIDEISGEIRTNKVLDYELHPKHFYFYVKVSDQGTPQHSVIVPVSIYLMDINDKIPFFKRRYTFTLNLPAYTGMTVGQVEAFDEDTVPNIPLQYSLESNLFSINKFTGVIVVKDESFLTNQIVMRIEVEVSDGTFKGKTNVEIETVYYKPDKIFHFLDKVYNVNVLENVKPFSVVKVINPVGYNRTEKLHYRILNTVPGFDIIKNVGVIITDNSSIFDYENVSFYILHIETVYNNIYARTYVNITIIDVNDNTPVFEQKKYFHPIDIETKKGTVLLKVQANDADSGENGKVRYSMLTKEEYFTCDSITGEISLLKGFIKSLTKPAYSLYIQASDNGTNILTSKVLVEIPVLNEDQPKFMKIYEASINEDITQGSTIFTIVALAPQNRQVFYQIYAGDEFEVFEIGLTTGELKLASSLDYEQINSYKLQVKAIDSLSGSWALTDCEITLNDVNDNPPMFEKPFYKVLIKENVAPGTTATTVKAKDSDQGLNSMISYSFESNNEVSHFFINSRTGDILTTQPLDAETKSEYFLKVTATDHGKPSKSTFVTVQINLADINDNKPLFYAAKYNFFVEKFLHSNQFIGKVTASDPDINTKLSYGLSKTSSFIKIDSVTGILYLTGSPSQMATILLEVMASDGVHVSFAEVVIDCFARNDYRPLVLEHIDVAVIENTMKNVIIAEINPVDRDKGFYGKLSYQIDSQLAAKYFTINELGRIYSTDYSLDCELFQKILVPIRVTDDGGLFSIIQVVVTVEDQNDNAPIFEYPSYRATVVTSQMTDESLLKVVASDPDKGSNSELFYVAQGLREGNVPIFINGSNGLISLSGIPKGSMYQFSVRVTDNGYPVQKSDTKIFIFVKGWNEEVLKFDKNVYYVTVSENAPVRSHIITVNALLLGDNGRLTYTIVDGNLPYTNVSQFFKINSVTGQVKIKNQLDYENIKRHKILVLVTSYKGDVSTCYIEVNVTNVNDNAPKFYSSSYSFKIAEDTEIGERLLQVSAFDLDELYAESTLVYSIVSENKDFFQVDENTGWLSLKKKLDREVTGSHEILVVATDVDGKFDSTRVQLLLVDVNDSPPIFLSASYFVTVKEDALVDQTILMVKAVDPDINQNLQYFILSNNSDDFTVDRQSGNINLLRQMTQVSYNFTVVAYDGIHTGAANIFIKVQDFNNHDPVCLLTFYEADVEENSDLKKTILRVAAEDKDPSDVLRYQIHGDGNGKFYINEKTGDLKASSYLDFEVETKYRFKVVVIDLAGHTCTSDIFIRVIDMNDNSPIFLQPLYKATLRENATYGVVVTQVKAFDKDSFKNGQISYSLLSNINNTFAVHSQGIITVNKPLEIQRSARYTITVVGTDQGTPSRSSNTSLDIIVISSNDSPPQFDQFGYLFYITENNSPGVIIGKIKVTSTTNFNMYAIVMEIVDPTFENLFSIEDNGDLKVLKVLDYEVQTRYVFSVKASYKSVPLSSMVVIEVLVDDTNDNFPQFNQAEYFTHIDENIRSGTFVTQVFAQDNDGSKENSKITYKIFNDLDVPFSIDFQGVIVVDGSIDREIKDKYEFEVIAVDNGIVQKSSKAKVKISVTDLNDNAPIISEYNTSIILQEGKLPGTEILKLSITDPDTKKNGPPFHCSLFGGDHSIFEIQTEDNNCVLRSKVLFTAKENPQHQFVIRVTDSGFPKQYSDSKVKIIIVKESYNSPVIQEPKVFFVIVSKPYGVTLIGKVSIFDKDENDIHQYRLTGGTMLEYFSIQPMTGVIEGRPKKGIYTLSVEVTDGRNSDASLFQIIVNERDHEVETQSIVISIFEMGVQEFMSKMTQFIKIISKITATSLNSVFLWSIRAGHNSTGSLRKRKNVENAVEVAVAVKLEDTLSYMDTQLLKKYVEDNKADFKNNDFNILVSNTECTLKSCGENMKCLVKLNPIENLSPFIPSGYMDFRRTENCYCNDGTEGSICHSVNPCSRNPCKGGEKCVATKNSYFCECVDPEKCGLSGESITLNGNSYIEYKLSKSFDELFYSLSLHFRTEYKEGYLIYAQAPGKDYFIVEVYGGYLQINFDFGSGRGNLQNKKVKVNDGNWHYISIQRNGNKISMYLDFNKQSLHAKAPGNSANINIDGRPLVLGAGFTDYGNTTFSGFIGCIKEPKLNKILLPFTGRTEIVSRVDLHNTENGCKDSGLCSVKHCPKFSDCVNTFSSHRCVCLTGHHGLSCMSNLTCEDRPCKNDGTCTYELVSNIVSYVCTCKEGFTGGQCHIELGECALEPCKNNGVCLPPSTESGYTCNCINGYSGKHCELNDNPCLSSPCYNGGVCQNIGNDFKCTCPSGKSGKQCSAGQHCLITNCENGASCYEKNDNAVCQCKEGFFGNRCQHDVNECLKDVCHSKGVCVNTLGSFYCTDSLAQVHHEKKQFSLILIVFGVCGLLLLIIVVAAVVFCCKRNHNGYQPTNQDFETRKYALNTYPIESYELNPPNPPPRGISVPPGYYDDQASSMLYDYSVALPGTSNEKIPFKNGSSRTSVEYNSEEELHWDYSGGLEAVTKSKMAREANSLGVTAGVPYGSDYVELPKLPVRPASRRSSVPGYSESENDIPKLPELPQQIRLSRLSLKSSNHSPSYLRRTPDRAPPIEENRYSLLSDDTDGESYLQDSLENETNFSDITNVTRPYIKPFQRAKSEVSDVSEDFETVTSLNSNNEDDDVEEVDPFDSDNTRKLERDIKRLFKDLQKRTEDD
ncbi:protocadherin Fat 1 [Hydra vulgaris]|uniref:Protocadherin Fat 1 n=1 Tax=Hydra vulgaris TaxID=6087 RepID=A0ABM4CZX9_HYDVU